MSMKKRVNGITSFHMVISKMFIAAASSPYKAGLPKTNTTISEKAAAELLAAIDKQARNKKSSEVH